MANKRDRDIEPRPKRDDSFSHGKESRKQYDKVTDPPKPPKPAEAKPADDK